LISGKRENHFFFPNYKVRLVIRIGGETLEYLLHQIGARIQVAQDADSDLICKCGKWSSRELRNRLTVAEQLGKGIIAEVCIFSGLFWQLVTAICDKGDGLTLC
jgi:hypothetical protein